MPRTLSLLLLVALAPALVACDSAAGVDAPGGVSAGEAEALEQAAEMLDQRRLPPEALGPESASESGPELSPESGPESNPPK